MTMTFQAHDGHGARSEELHRHILRSHLAYLNQEETPAKLEQRRNLESLISEFLCVVAHSAKFTFVEVANILNQSIEKNPNFSAYKAASAFEALEKYATNLISHPWRKEYKTVKLYSGFYKHSVESQLIGGSSVFHLLGYQFTEEGVLYLDEPVDPDKVARVALDCLIATVECQIMVQICEKVKSFKCSWFEIHNIRQDYVCGIEEAVRILHQLKRNAAEQEKQERWLRDQENGSLREDKILSKPESNYQKTGILIDVSNTWPSNNSYTGYNDNPMILQPNVVGSFASKPNKSSLLTHSKLPSWSEGVSSQISDYQGHNLISRSDETDGYNSRSFDDHVQPNYSFLNKSSNPVSRYISSDITPDNWKDSWDILQSSLQSSSYHGRHDSFINCDHDSHRTGYNNTVPNVSDAYSSHIGHIYPSHPMLPVGVPVYPYPLPHDFSVPSRQCECRTCCEHQLSMMSSKYQQFKDASSNNFESSSRSGPKLDLNRVDDPNDICSAFLKMDVENPNPSVKSRHFPVATPAYASYQIGAESSSDVILRSNIGNKSQHNTCKRGSYYDNVPSTLDNDANGSFSLVGQSLNPKCDFQSNGVLACNVATLNNTKSRIQKGTLVNDSGGNSVSIKSQTKKNYTNSSTNVSPEQMLEVTSPVHSDSKSVKSHPPLAHKDSKSSKKWSCASCTFHNAAEKSICDMCGRSKHPGPEVTPLVSGGRECPQCTLVNKKDSEDCTACGASLKDSPTYI